MARLSPLLADTIPANRVVEALREPHRSDIAAMGEGYIHDIMASAIWQRSLEINGEFVYGLAVVPEGRPGTRSAWLAGFPGKLQTASNMRPVIREIRAYMECGPFEVYKCFAYLGLDCASILFAHFMGFAYDPCEPDRVSPGGRALMLMKRGRIGGRLN